MKKQKKNTYIVTYSRIRATLEFPCWKRKEFETLDSAINFIRFLILDLKFSHIYAWSIKDPDGKYIDKKQIEAAIAEEYKTSHGY